MKARTLRLGGAVLALGLLFAAPVAAQEQGRIFPDVPRDHWAYDAVMQLAQKGILKGYPPGSFDGRRAITRYETTLALQRTREQINKMLLFNVDPGPGPRGPQGLTGPQGLQGEPGPAGPPGIIPPGILEIQRELPLMRGDVERLRQQFGGFRSELDRLRGEISQIKTSLGDVTDRTETIRKEYRYGPLR